MSGTWSQPTDDATAHRRAGGRRAYNAHRQFAQAHRRCVVLMEIIKRDGLGALLSRCCFSAFRALAPSSSFLAWAVDDLLPSFLAEPVHAVFEQAELLDVPA